ncbi:hypothetical protein [Anaeromyxobacter oryzae]|uniref:Uncharacterized protein n=1 Tax=Anaeromyxobacter oryzae TaxID=2918170 RepID=A0ABN6MRV6_9BACT|nr:hypothetical protein [Anaeromyxobacter oryzae]BDG02370.1 hypothetical protein AMOR_13660 [Anaeromyxobacter oryzae]
MSDRPPVVVLVVGPRTTPRRSATLTQWLRWLLPAALLVVSQVPLGTPESEDVITLDADSIESGPLSLADAIGKARGGGDGA